MLTCDTVEREEAARRSERRPTMRKWVNGTAIRVGFALGAIVVFVGRSSQAQPLFPASDAPAGYLVFPKVVVDATGSPAAAKRDTFIQLTNTSRQSPNRVVHCFYIDGSTCDELLNFSIELPLGRPVAWSVNEGLPSAGILALAKDPFVGELKCIEVDTITNEVPVTVNDLKGEATIFTVTAGNPGGVDIRSYNAIGLQTTTVSAGATPSPIGKKCIFGAHPGVACTGTDDTPCLPGGQCGVTMCLGSSAGSPECPTANYVSCPNTLILNNFFDFATDPVSGKEIRTELTFVPCTEDIADGRVPAITRVQFLIFNEFEQRTSTATQVECFKEVQLSNIDAKPGSEAASVFNVGVQGTLVGQTRIRPVQVSDPAPTVGHGLLAIAEEFHGPASVAANLNQVGINQGKGDFVRYIPLLP